MCRSKGKVKSLLESLEEKGILEILISNAGNGCKISKAKLKERGLDPKKIRGEIYKVAQGGSGPLPKDSVSYDGKRIHVESDASMAVLSVSRNFGYPTS